MRPDSQLRAIHDMRPLGDRRGRIRLEVVGSLWGTLEVSRQAQVINISRTGALIASPVPAAIDSTQTVRLTLEGYDIQLQARVRHQKRIIDAGDEGAQYRIGLEFLEVPAALVSAIE